MAVVFDVELLAALEAHLGVTKARGFISLLWHEEVMWWLGHEWEKLRVSTPSLPAWELAAVRALFPIGLVPQATRMADLVDVRRPMVRAIFAVMLHPDALEHAIQLWLAIQTRHGVAMIAGPDVHEHQGSLVIDGRVVAPSVVHGELRALTSETPTHPSVAGSEADDDYRPLRWALLDEAQLVVDSYPFCNECLWVSESRSTHVEVMSGRAWDEDLAGWLDSKATLGRPACIAWFYERGPDVEDWAPWRDTWLAVLDGASKRVLDRVRSRLA